MRPTIVFILLFLWTAMCFASESIYMLTKCEDLSGWSSGQLSIDAAEGQYAIVAPLPAGRLGFLSYDFSDTGKDIADKYSLSFWWKVEGSGLQDLKVEVRNYPLVGGMKAVYAVWSGQTSPQGWQLAVVQLNRPLFDSWGGQPDQIQRYISFRTITSQDADVRLFIDHIVAVDRTFSYQVAKPVRGQDSADHLDFNDSGTVDFSDFLLFVQPFGTTHPHSNYDPIYDLDGDGTIGFGDFIIFSSGFGSAGLGWSVPITFRNHTSGPLRIVLGTAAQILSTHTIGIGTTEILVPIPQHLLAGHNPSKTRYIPIWAQVANVQQTRLSKNAVLTKRTSDIRTRPYLITESREEMQQKILSHAVFLNIYGNIKQSVQKHVERHKIDPYWMVSRLAMYWKTHYEIIYADTLEDRSGGRRIHYLSGEGYAPVPTVMYAGGPGEGSLSTISTPPLEDIIPFFEDPKGLYWISRKEVDKPYVWAPTSHSSNRIKGLNEKIMEYAKKAAFVAWVEDDEDYAKFAADIFWTYAQGMYYRRPPSQLDHTPAGRGQSGGLTGPFMWHEKTARLIGPLYDYLYDYLVTDYFIQPGHDTDRNIDLIEQLFQRWADIIIEGGWGSNNFLTFEADLFLSLGLALESNSAYPDGKGYQYYIDHFTTKEVEGQHSFQSQALGKFSQNGENWWPESPGYAIAATRLFFRILKFIDSLSGTDYLSMGDNTVKKALLNSAQFLLPNFLISAIGDTYYGPSVGSTEEEYIKYTRDLDSLQAETNMTALINAKIHMGYYDRNSQSGEGFLLNSVAEFKSLTPEESLSFKNLWTRTYWNSSINYLIQRDVPHSSIDSLVTYGLAATLVGSKGKHRHDNGISIELYGQGLPLGLEASRCGYKSALHENYCKKASGHNTVIRHGSENGSENSAPDSINIQHLDPPEVAEDHVSKWVSFVDVKSEAGIDQRRLVSVIRTSPVSGYYVDIFRSRRSNSDNDYLYHNLGHSVELRDESDNLLIPDNTSNLITYETPDNYTYFTDEESFAHTGDFSANFLLQLPLPLPQGSDLYKGDIGMKMWMAGEPSRTLFTANTPSPRGFRGRFGEEIDNLSVPMVVVRQSGEAWTKPFVAVFESYNETDGKSISAISSLSSSQTHFVGLMVESSILNGRVEAILNNTSTSSDVTVSVGGEAHVFRGTYGVTSKDNSGLQYLYLGNGRKLEAYGYSITSTESVTASLYKDGDDWYISTLGSVTLTTPDDNTYSFSTGHEQPVSD